MFSMKEICRVINTMKIFPPLILIMFVLTSAVLTRAQQPAPQQSQTPPAQAPAPQPTPVPPEAHEYAPLQEREINYKDWTFKSAQTGERVNLRDWSRGKRLVLVVYFAPWCRNWKLERRSSRASTRSTRTRASTWWP
jgi:hypothetical protein